ncbi:MAG: cytochrome c biogenesis protein CcsA [Spirochaetes bacterium]|nr:cytochrome c biogenesis protein CcsA [Spirochaetota bacterium]
MLITRLVYIFMPTAVIMAFCYAPAAAVLGETSRLLYFHVPLAWISVMAFAVSGVAAMLFLADKKSRFTYMEDSFHNSASLGTLTAVLATASGSVWAKLMWGSYWNWDPRQTSIVILLLIYSAYFSLRSALEGKPARGRLSAAYLIIAMTAMPFFVFVVPRVFPSLHPDPVINPDMKIHLEIEMKLTLLISVVAFSLLYFYLLEILNRLSRIRNAVEVQHHE